MDCIRAGYLEKTGIDTEIICSGCDESSGCVAVDSLRAITEMSKLIFGIHKGR